MNVALHPGPARPMTREEFFLWAERQDGRYEFDGVRPVLMVGGTNRHGLITANLNAHLFFRLRGTSCRVIGSEGGGVAVSGNKVRYPDATVTCSAIPLLERLVPDPVVVFEVVSPSSALHDQVTKLLEYHSVPSIRRYVVVEQDGAGVTAYHRGGDAPWTATPFLGSDVLPLPEIGIELPLADIYEGITFPEADAQPPPG